MSARQSQPHSHQDDLSALLDMVGTLKDDVSELKANHNSDATRRPPPPRRSIAPGHSSNEPWSPCDRQEVNFYGSLTHLH